MYVKEFLTAAALVATLLGAGYDEATVMKGGLESCLRMATAYNLNAEAACKRW